VLYFSLFDDLLYADGVQEKAALLGFDGSVYWLYSVLIIIGNSSLEEYYWRWFGFSKLKRVVPLGWALIFSALGFTLHHLIVLTVYFAWPYAVAFALCVFVGGVVFACLYHHYDSIWSPWVCHAIIDAGIMAVGYNMIFC
jgi:membrane protease YdiL (CAAX protease family)